MSLTQEQIKKIAKNLSKIHISNDKVNEIKGDLNNILKYFELLEEINTENIKPTYSVISKKNILRKDIILEKKVSPKDLLLSSKEQIIANQIAINNIMK